MLGESSAALDAQPLRHRAVDAINDALKRLPLVQPVLKRGLKWAVTLSTSISRR